MAHGKDLAKPGPDRSHSGCQCHDVHDLLLGIIPHHFRAEDTDIQRSDTDMQRDCDLPRQQVMPLESCCKLGTSHILSHFIFSVTPDDQYY